MIRFLTTLVVTLLICGSLTTAGDWPQILGPARNAVAQNEKLLDRWPADGPRLVWKMPVGRGYAGLAVADKKAILFDRHDDFEVLTAFNAATGERLWSKKSPVRYTSTIAPDDGPRCVPLINNDKVYSLGVAGTFSAHKLSDGELVWRRELLKDFDVPPSYFGVGSTPVLFDDKLLVNIGGRSGAGIVAFKISDGTTAWRSTDEGASYSSPIVYPSPSTGEGGERSEPGEGAGRRPLAIFVTRLNCVALDPATGKEQWRFAFGQRGPTVNAATPLLIDDHLFVSASYGVGGVWAKLSFPSQARPTAEPGATGVTELWRSEDLISSQYTTCVYAGGALFGIHGRQDQPPAHLRSIDPNATKVLWSEDNFGTGNLILAGDKLLILKTDGELILAAADKSRYRQLARAQVLEGTAQPLPALAHGLLYARDENELKCVRVGEERLEARD